MQIERDVVDLLLAAGLLSSADVVDDELAIYDVSRRNRNFRVVSGRGPSYFVKVARGPGDSDGIAREAAFFEASTMRSSAQLGRHLPPFHGYYPERSALVLGLVDGRSLTEHHATGRFSRAVAHALGAALAALHSAASAESLAQQPYGLSMHRTVVAELRTISAASLDLVKRVQAVRRSATCSLRWRRIGGAKTSSTAT